jgi:hypothetical protein
MFFIVRFLDFWELLVILEDELWILPTLLPSKYESRIKAKNQRGQHTIVWVDSTRHAKPAFTCQKIVKGGMWICQGDLVAFGGVSPCVFGIPLHPSITFEGLELEQWALSKKHVRVAYHGTSRELFSTISESGLKCTFGMLGTGVYVGSFWKACRFACRGQDYVEKLHPTVFRVVWECAEDDILKFPRKFIDGFCLCAQCFGNPDQKSYCAHTADWEASSKHPPQKPLYKGPWKAGQLFPCKYPSGKWATQNEEWVLNPSLIVALTEAVQINTTTVSGPHYDPIQRNIKFL